MRIRLTNVLFAIVFLLMLLIPTAFVRTPGGGFSAQENRMLASRPGIMSSLKNPEAFIRRFGDWFSDNAGFRDSLIDLHKRIERMGALVHYTDGPFRYLIGERGHCYSAELNGSSIRRFQGRNPLSNDQRLALSNWLNHASLLLEEKDTPFLMMLCTNKESVYPEHYPKAIHRGLGPTELERTVEYLQEHTSVDIFDTRQCLWDQKENFLLYNKSVGDLRHYNEIGAYFSYVELMKHMQPHFPDMRPFALEDIGISYDTNGIPSVTLKAEASFKKMGADFFDDAEVFRPYTWEHEAYENIDLSLPTVLFLRDSFASYDDEGYLMRYIPHHFGKTILIHYRCAKHLEAYVSLYKPDIVVFVAGEGMLYWFCNILLEDAVAPENEL